MYEKLNYVSYNSASIRNSMLGRVKNHVKIHNTLKRHHTDTSDGRSVFNYYYKAEMAKYLMACELSLEAKSKKIDYDDTLIKLFNMDSNQLSIECTYCCWLTADNWKLELEFPELVEDSLSISYGLVLQYTNPILRSASYYLGISEEEEETTYIDKEMRHLCEREAARLSSLHYEATPDELIRVYSNNK